MAPAVHSDKISLQKISKPINFGTIKHKYQNRILVEILLNLLFVRFHEFKKNSSPTSRRNNTIPNAKAWLNQKTQFLLFCKFDDVS